MTPGDGWMSADDFKGGGNRLKNYAHGTVGIFHYVAEAGNSGSGQMVHTANTEMYGDPDRVAAWRTLAGEVDDSWSPPDATGMTHPSHSMDRPSHASPTHPLLHPHPRVPQPAR